MGMTTYSAKDTTGAIVSPLAGSLILAGGDIGANKFVVRMTTTRTEHQVAADGAVMISYLAGDNGEVEIECQQTSLIHQFLKGWFNLNKTAADAGDVSGWAATTLMLQNLLDNSKHLCTGVSADKIPEKTYAAAGGMVTWRLMCGNIVNL